MIDAGEIEMMDLRAVDLRQGAAPADRVLAPRRADSPAAEAE